MIGQHPYPSDMMNGLLRLVVARPEMPVVWLEDLRYDAVAEGLPQAQTSVQWLKQYHKNFSHIATDDVSGFLDALTQQRGVEPSAIFEPEVELPNGLNALLNRSIDLKPILVYVPGMNLFSSLLDKLPRVSLRSVLGAGFLFLLFVGFLNYRDYDLYDEKLDAVRGKALVASLALGNAVPSPKAVLNAEGYLDKGSQLLAKAEVPKSGRLSFPYVETYLKNLRKREQEKMEKLRSEKVIPHLYRYRLRSQLESHSLLGSMGRFPEVYVSLEQSEVQDAQEGTGASGKKTEEGAKKAESGASAGSGHASGDKKKGEKGRDDLESSRQIRPLAEHKEKPLLALYVSGSTLAQVLMIREMLKDTRAGRLVIPINLSKLKNDSLEQTALQVVREMTGYTGERAGLFRFEGVEQLFKQGKATFYFMQLEQAGSLSNVVPKIVEFVERYEKSRAILVTYQERNFAAFESLAPRFVRLKQQTYESRVARDFLHKQTSTSFFRELMNNGYLSQNINRPLILSLCIQYYLLVGRAPRNLGVIYDRLVRSMLDHGHFEMTLKMKVLSALAFRSMQLQRKSVQRDEALETIVRVARLDLQRASKLLREMVENGVLRVLSVGDVGFMDQNFRLLGASYRIAKLSFVEQKHFLLQQEKKIMSFFAGVQPELSRLVGAWLEDFASIDKVLQARGAYEKWINPYLYILPYAALAVNNGEVEQRHVKRLETLLFSLMEHKRSKAMRQVVEYALRSLSTPGVKAWILQGLDQDVPYDTRLLRLARYAPSDIYVSSIQRWLRRLRTEKDHQEARHAFPKNKPVQEETGIVKDSQQRFRRREGRKRGSRLLRGKRGPKRRSKSLPVLGRRFRGKIPRKTRTKPSVGLVSKKLAVALQGPKKPRRSSSSIRRAVLWAYLALSHVGTPEAIQTILEDAKRESDPRFQDSGWRSIRFRALYVLLTRGYAEKVLPIYRSLLNGKERSYWMGLLRFFSQINSREAAKLLIDVLKTPRALQLVKPYQTLQSIPYKKRRKMKDFYKRLSTVRKEYYKGQQILSSKERIVRTLARFDEDLVIPLLKALLKDQSLSLDTQIFAAMTLAYTHENKHFPLVWLTLQRAMGSASNPFAGWPKRLRQQFARYVCQALSSFSSREAYKALSKLLAEPVWSKDLGRRLGWYTSRFKLPELEEQQLTKMLCSSPKEYYSIYSSLGVLSRINTESARQSILQLLDIYQGAEGPALYEKFCKKKAHKSMYESLRKRGSLYAFVSSLRAFRSPVDLPRFARWARSGEGSLRRAAIYALGDYKSPEAAYVLLELLEKEDKDTSSIMYALRRQKNPAVASSLLGLLERKRQQYVQFKLTQRPRKKEDFPAHNREIRKRLQHLRGLVGIVAEVAGREAIPVVAMYMRSPAFFYTATNALYKVSQRRRGSFSKKALIAVLEEQTNPLGEASAQKGKARQRPRIRKRRRVVP